MKDLFKAACVGVTYAIGFCAGWKLWEDVLEDKVEDLKERLSKKEEK
jgi:hypothetical protein